MSRPIANGFGTMSNGSNPSIATNSMAMTGRTQLTSNGPHPTSLPAASGGAMGSSSMSRAERFEDEKRRIIESCFSKLDANGQLAESYITHIRIIEDAQYPSAPAPPESAESNKKPRLIIIAVRSTGRVRMHKARENTNGSFSIGKTWNLEELSAIETYSGTYPPQTDREAQYRGWAGSVGFTVTIAKSYYWQAGTSKEKDFFIASAVKIYRKYTKGLVPELKGFDEREKALILGQTPSQQQLTQPGVTVPPEQARQLQTNLAPGMRAESRDASPMQPPQPPFAQRPQSREESRYRQSPGPPESLHDPSPQSRQQSQSPAPISSRFPAGREAAQPSPLSGPRQFASQEQIRAPSQDRRGEYAGRPGTSPAPGPRTPLPSSLQTGVAQTPSIVSVEDSPSVSSMASSAAPKVRQASPVRQRAFVDSVPEEQLLEQRSPERFSWQDAEQEPGPPAPAYQANGAAASPVSPTSGASLFASTKERWMNHRISQDQPRPLQPQLQQPQPQQLEPPASTAGPPQLPPIQTSQSFSGDQQERNIWHPPTGGTASSAGLDLGDAAAINALTSYWGPDTASTNQTTPQTPLQTQHAPLIKEPGSPPTPERSRRRPALNERGTHDDLRPAPLKPSGSFRGPDDEASRQQTAQTESTDIKPLALRSKRQSRDQQQTQHIREQKLAIPGAFHDSSVEQSPMATPGQEEPPTQKAGPVDFAERQMQPAETAPAVIATDKSAEEEDETDDSAQYRPGLGPMIKKNAVRDRFKKAAATANAFKPRPGGAAEKILRAKAEREAGAASPTTDVDGISGFVPRPGAAAAREDPMAAAAAAPVASVGEPIGLGVQGADEARSPTVEVENPTSPYQDEASKQSQTVRAPVQLTDEAAARASEHRTPEQQALEDAGEHAEREMHDQQEAVRKVTPQVKIKRRSNYHQRNLAALGIDPSILKDKGLDFENLLEDFGWSDRALEPKKLAELEADLRREQGRLEAVSWLSGDADVARGEKVTQVEGLLDKAIAECDELEGLLTLYSVELGSLNEDVAFIEAQSQGLQVQSANQKGLLTELRRLVDTLSLDGRELRVLHSGDLGDVQGLNEVEASLVRLWQAMITIDPSIRSTAVGRPGSRGGLSAGEESASETLSSMKAVRERRDVYEREVVAFVQRFTQHLDAVFATSFEQARGRLLRPASSGGKKLNKDVLTELVRGRLWAYGPLMLFVRDLNPPAWQTMLHSYSTKAQPVYGDAFKENLTGWKRAVRKPTSDEIAEVLFTHAERDDGSGSSGGAVALASRKLTIKRSQTLAKTLRNANGGNRSPTESRHAGQLMGAEVFAGAMDEMAPLVSQEQNFVAELFHASTLQAQDFLEAVGAAPPERRGRNIDLRMPKPADPDREMAKRVQTVMDEIFAFFATEMGVMLEWSLADDPLQGVGVMACLSRHAYYLQETGQDFLLQLIERLQEKLRSLWSRFVDEQVRAVEELRVRGGRKRKGGVIGFVKSLPQFCAAVENVFSTVAREEYERPADTMVDVRRLVDDTYTRLNRAIFDNLHAIAKESGVAAAASGGAHGVAGGLKALTGTSKGDDNEDKEALYAQIMLIENLNHYVEEVDDLGGRLVVLAQWKAKANKERAEAFDRYIGSVVRRPLGPLLDFLDSIDSQFASHPNPAAIASRPTFSRKAARSTFSSYDSKRVREGIETLKKRIEKHFGEADEEQLSRNLVALVCGECEKVYERTIERMENAVRSIWPPTEGEKGVEVEMSREDVRAAFKR
ncbi:hypothetical protein BAUCODRAFT_356102 [Baudoinia panamericana UAMH 10762]|uniref:Exocyst complex component Sec3 PIP2-binding N-terminal domain-containing protein n=1 Tax=Baudoinia panamericana (strain UAMH 10762) TaxID=717646 RepID=M2MSU0_BAUPA|nr:uncharacterized protein BAUCODRAFT_356102 [Baudoinia panamericana UAMH 10762]EMC99941.1 hypothetical protein BAUCODRAFT_356102 [Baudoinia panamericana UAMH 10762]